MIVIPGLPEAKATVAPAIVHQCVLDDSCRAGVQVMVVQRRASANTVIFLQLTASHGMQEGRAALRAIVSITERSTVYDDDRRN